jgi:surface protein
MSIASVSYGIIKQIMDFNIYHTCYTEPGSSGSPIMNLLNNKVIGIHKEASRFNFNIGSFIKNPINKFIQNEDKSKSDNNIIKIMNKEKNIKLSKTKISNNNIINELNNKYKNKINLIYFSKYGGFESIFGYEFVKNNKKNFDLLINGIEYNLIDYYYELKKGENTIQLIIKNKITNLQYMFYNCICLKNIDGLKYLDTKNVNNFSYMFFKCHILSDISALQNWDVSNADNFEGMFSGCSSLSDINGLRNWNVSNVKNFNAMFKGCSSSLNLKSLLKWKISEVQYESMK